MTVEPNLCKAAVELAAPRRPVATCQLVEDHPADVVPVAGVFASRVAKPDDEQIERRGALAPAPRQTQAITPRRCPARPALRQAEPRPRRRPRGAPPPARPRARPLRPRRAPLRAPRHGSA